MTFSPDPSQPESGSGPPAVGQKLIDVDSTLSALREHGYLADTQLATTVFLLTRLGKPVLLEGPAGVGKTQLALSLADVTGRRLVRLQCYEGQDETKALYEWDYGKQLLYTQILREKVGELVADTADLGEAVQRIGEHDSVFFSERFLSPRPLLEAVRSTEPVVLLIDEIDRADEALEAVLLEILAEFQISIPEIGTVTAVNRPYVVLTSNNTRDLSAALKRRCLHLFLNYPTAQRELDIVRSKRTGLADALAAQLVDVVRGLRELDLRKSPSISETIDWARTLAVLGVTELKADVLANTLNAVVKYERDVDLATRALPRLIDPNAEVPDHLPGHDHHHDHHHGHSHSNGDHSHSRSQSDQGGDSGRKAHPNGATPVVGDVEGAEVRRQREEQPHTDYYGSPGSSPDTRKVTPGQGGRSFPGTRRRPV